MESSKNIDFAKYFEKCKDIKWVLNNMYWIKDDKNDRIVKFKLWPEQEKILDRMHHKMLLPKARQIGISTLIGGIYFYYSLFKKDVKMSIVDKNEDFSKKKLDEKVKRPYERLGTDIEEDEELREFGKLIKNCALIKPEFRRSTSVIEFTTGSRVEAMSSIRGDGYGMAWVSEMGWISANYPEKADEIRSGCLQAVAPKGFVFLEGTFERGKIGGVFKDMIDSAKEVAGQKLTHEDYRIVFCSWWKQKEYQLEIEDTSLISKETRKYQEKVRKVKGINLTDQQLFWYQKKRSNLKDAMFTQFPTYLEEIFMGSATGSIYEEEMMKIKEESRIKRVVWDRTKPVYTFWDIGDDDSTAVWIGQKIFGEFRWLEYWSSRRNHPAVYVAKVKEWDQKYDFIDKIYFPHDAKQKLGRGGFTDHFYDAGMRNRIKIVPKIDSTWNGIAWTRTILDKSWFDEIGCSHEFKVGEITLPSGLTCLESYRSTDKKDNGVDKKPVKNIFTHGADAIRTAGEAEARGLIMETSGLINRGSDNSGYGSFTNRHRSGVKFAKKINGRTNVNNGNHNESRRTRHAK